MGAWLKQPTTEFVHPDDNSVGVNGYKRSHMHYSTYMMGQELYAKQIWDGTLIQSELPDAIRTEPYGPMLGINDPTLRINDIALQKDIIRQIDRAERIWDSQSIQGVMGGYIPTPHTSKELRIIDEDLRMEMQKAEQKWDSQSIQNTLDDYTTTVYTPKELRATDADLRIEIQKAKQLLYELYGVQ